MAEFTIKDVEYRAGKLNAFQQFHVSRRLLPVVSSLRDILGGAGSGSSDSQLAEALEPVARAIASLDDKDCDYVLHACLGVVQRRQPGSDRWAEIWNKSANRLMFDDIDMLAMVGIAGRVIMDNLAGFMDGLPQISQLDLAAASR